MKTTKTAKSKKIIAHAEKPAERYFEGLGRRKTATARVRIWPNLSEKSRLNVNGVKYDEYFKVSRYQESAFAPLKLLKLNALIEAKTYGGGIMAQAEAVALGAARAIIKLDPTQKALLSASGFLTRDSRMVERKKPGLRKARRAHQWKKR